jgi:hypothetical protein
LEKHSVSCPGPFNFRIQETPIEEKPGPLVSRVRKDGHPEPLPQNGPIFKLPFPKCVLVLEILLPLFRDLLGAEEGETTGGAFGFRPFFGRVFSSSSFSPRTSGWEISEITSITSKPPEFPDAGGISSSSGEILFLSFSFSEEKESRKEVSFGGLEVMEVISGLLRTRPPSSNDDEIVFGGSEALEVFFGLSPPETSFGLALSSPEEPNLPPIPPNLQDFLFSRLEAFSGLPPAEEGW